MSSELPEHLERLCRNNEYGQCVEHPEDVPRLRAILAAAVEVADMPTAIDHHPMGYGGCLWCDHRECSADCPHRQLKEALADD